MLYRITNKKKPRLIKRNVWDVENALWYALLTLFLWSGKRIIQNFTREQPNTSRVSSTQNQRNGCFSIFKDESRLKLKVYIKIGEYERIDEKKYQVITIEFISNKNYQPTEELIAKALKAHINIFKEKQSLKLEFPMIL